MRLSAAQVPSWRQRGAAAVEMAIIMPLLLLFIGGIVDFGRFFFVQIQLTNAAREGARVAVIGEPNVAGRVETALGAGLYGEINPPAITPCAGAGGDATVTLTIPFDWIVLEPALAMVGASGTLPATASSTAVMRCGG